MKLLIQTVLAAFIFLMAESKTTTPKVQVYSQSPGEYGKNNTLICEVSQFQPPTIEFDLLKDGKVMPGAVVTDLSFADTWQFHLTKSVAFTPLDGEEYTCRVTHVGNTRFYKWENNM